MAAGRAPGWAVGFLSAGFLLLRFDFISCESQRIFGAMNGNITFNTTSFMPFKEILWKKGKDKIIEWEENSEAKPFPPFIGRVHLDSTSGHLTIFNLKPQDEDEYEIESPSVQDNTKFVLNVIEPLPSPTLNCTETNESIRVQCIIPGFYRSHVNLTEYSWDCSPPQCINCSSDPSEVCVNKEEYLSEKIQCNISNPLFKRTASIALATCVPGDNSRYRYGLVAIPITIIILVFLFIIGRQKYIKK
ncbi:lymphocyte function-associated antigen 3 [Manis javanica]|uniref:lymphocyte function-associated antigen 3 n=1 Tax=Manis javanica TaxID=9974 RepID=UPI000812E6F6|nr:lymphocyte function-associated antigen 3 [Manis javanica]